MKKQIPNIPVKRIYSRVYMGMPPDKILSKEIFNNAHKKGERNATKNKPHV